jgi:hypothetical protein
MSLDWWLIKVLVLLRRSLISLYLCRLTLDHEKKWILVGALNLHMKLHCKNYQQDMIHVWNHHLTVLFVRRNELQ